MINLIPQDSGRLENIPLLKKSHQSKTLLIRKMLLFTGVVLFLSGPASYYFLPLLEARGVANRLYTPISESGDSLEQVNSNLGGLLALISGEEAPPSQMSFPNLPKFVEDLKEKIAGEESKFTFYDLLYQLVENLHLVRESSSGAGGFGRSSAGSSFTATKNEQLEAATDDLQYLRDRAQICEKVVDSSQSKFVFLSSVLPSHFPSPLADAEPDLKSFIEEGVRYLLEVEKTAHYYNVITDVQIELAPVIISIIDFVADAYTASDPAAYLEEIDPLAQAVDDLSAKVKDLSSSLPEGMEELHNDNLAVFTLISRLLDGLREALAIGDFNRFNNALAEFEEGLRVLANRAKSYELGFWRKTYLFKGYQELINRCDLLKARLDQFR